MPRCGGGRLITKRPFGSAAPFAVQRCLTLDTRHATLVVRKRESKSTDVCVSASAHARYALSIQAPITPRYCPGTYSISTRPDLSQDKPSLSGVIIDWREGPRAIRAGCQMGSVRRVKGPCGRGYAGASSASIVGAAARSEAECRMGGGEAYLRYHDYHGVPRTWRSFEIAS